MAPPRLRVDLVDREPVARAQRRGPNGLEQGFVDRQGQWMSARQAQGLSAAASEGPLVLGWQERHRPVISAMLQTSERLKADLRQIRFEPNGSLTVQSTRLGEVRLGPADNRLQRRLEVLDHLIETLPPQLQSKPLQALDLTEPEQPELALKQPPKAPAAGP
jgi:cell division protein FtsQ